MKIFTSIKSSGRGFVALIIWVSLVSAKSGIIPGGILGDDDLSSCRFDGCDELQSRTFTLNASAPSHISHIYYKIMTTGFPMSSCTSWEEIVFCTTLNATLQASQPGLYAFSAHTDQPDVIWSTKQVLGTFALPLLDIDGDSFSVDGLVLYGANAGGVPLGLPIIIAPQLGEVFSMTGTTNEVMLIPSFHGPIAAYLTNGVPHASIWINDTINGHHGIFMAQHTPVIFGPRAIFLVRFNPDPASSNDNVPPTCKIVALDVHRTISDRLQIAWNTSVPCPIKGPINGSPSHRKPPILGLNNQACVSLTIDSSPKSKTMQRGTTAHLSGDPSAFLNTSILQTRIVCVSSTHGRIVSSAKLDGETVHSFCRFRKGLINGALNLENVVFALTTLESGSNTIFQPSSNGRLLAFNASNMNLFYARNVSLGDLNQIAPISCVQFAKNNSNIIVGISNSLGVYTIFAFSVTEGKLNDHSIRKFHSNNTRCNTTSNCVTNRSNSSQELFRSPAATQYRYKGPHINITQSWNKTLGFCGTEHVAQIIGVAPSIIAVPCASQVFVVDFDG
eukprot:gene4589-8579_t